MHRGAGSIAEGLSFHLGYPHLIGSSNSGSLLIVWLPVNALRMQEKKDQVLEFLPPMRETWIQFMDPGFSLAWLSPGSYEYLESNPIDKRLLLSQIDISKSYKYRNKGKSLENKVNNFVFKKRIFFFCFSLLLYFSL